MTVRPYAPDDYEMVALWRLAHADGPVDPAALPPLGVIVSDDTGPLAALFCIEPAHYPAAQLELPVTRPGLSAAEATAAFTFALESVMALAGVGWDPPGSYSAFRACAPAPIARILMRFGFVRESPKELIPLIYRCQHSGSSDLSQE